MQNAVTSSLEIGTLKPNRSDFDGRRSVESVDKRTVSLLRLLLASAALLITLIDPSMPEHYAMIFYLALAGYWVYGAALYVFALWGTLYIPVRLTHWIDVAWYTVLVILSNGTSSIFFFFFFFSLLVASFRSGYREGIYVTGASTILFIVAGYLGSPSGEAFELNRFLIRPIYLCVFGYMIASWGGRELVFKRRLSLLRDVNKLSNPRFGVDATLQSIVGKLRAFYDADCCVLLTNLDDTTKFKVWTSYDSRPKADHRRSDYSASFDALTDLLADKAVLFTREKSTWFQQSRCYSVEPATGKMADTRTVDCRAAADKLGVHAFLTVPLYQHEEFRGRLCLLSNRDVFTRSDIDFLLQLTSQIMPGIENVQLLDKIASHAATRERQKTSRDIHDSTIQPYIGLKLGLEALELKAESGRPLDEDIRRLIRLADGTISELRGVVKTLGDEDPEDAGSVLTVAITHQARKYREFYGIEVDVQVCDGFQVNDRLAAEAFQIITEGLSNVRRHTESKDVCVRVGLANDTLNLEVENAIEPGSTSAVQFLPKSISSRAQALGGKASIEITAHSTRVTVNIPL